MKATEPGKGIGTNTGVFAALFASTFVLGVVILYVAFWHTNRIERSVLERSAASYAEAIAQMRQFYASEVLDRIDPGKVTFTHDYKNLKNAIPVPATMTNDLSKFINSRNPDVKLSIVSEYPFSFRLPRALTEFEEEAFEHFRLTAERRFSKVYDDHGQTIFRFAAPMLMTQACVSCHNSHPNSTKTDWRVGDVRGLQVVEIFGSDLVIENKLGFAYILASVIAFFAVTASLILWIIARAKNAETTIRLDLEESKAQLEASNRSLQNMAITDYLTGLFNRQRSDAVLLEEVNRSKRFNTPLGFAIFDIDHFKRINDHYGHDIGDEVLIEFANILKERVRETDTVGRWGGEEFIIICPSTDKEQLIHFANVLRELIAETEFSIVGRVTASFGLTTYQLGETPNEIEIRADAALYEAKEKGRNQCVYL